MRRVPYVYRLYQPILGEPALRMKLRRLRGRVTVPVLVTDGGEVLSDSLEIARWADARGEGPTLFPQEHATAIARFVELSEQGLAAGRALTLTRMLDDADALAEMVPRALQKVKGLGARIGAAGIRRTLRKYAGDAPALDTHRRTLIGVLDALRAALAGSGPGKPPTLLGRFTFADIAASQVLVSAGPPAFGLKLRPASRRCWTDPELRERYADLVAWRDQLYETHRPRPS